MSSNGEKIDLLSYAPPAKFSSRAHIKSMADYRRMYKESLENPAKFWREISREANFEFKNQQNNGGTNDQEFCDYNFDVRQGPIFSKWMPGSSTNVCYNCLDRNIDRGLGDKVAFYW